jgi:predicted Zn-dependent protease
MPGPEGEGQGEGPGHRYQKLALSPEQELAVGRKAYQKVLREASGDVLPEGSWQSQRVRRVVAKLKRAVDIEPLRREINLHIEGFTFDWNVSVIVDRQINAFCLPAGEIVVFTGIFNVAEDDDQLATVLSHEMSHALAHHASERIARKEQEGSSVLGILSSLRFNRDQEEEADKIGLFLMTFAGYNPSEAVRFWERMGQAMGSSSRPEILSDHPNDATRIRNMQRWVPLARAALEAYRAGRIAPGRGGARGPRRGPED